MAYDGWGPVPLTPVAEVTFMKCWLAKAHQVQLLAKREGYTHLRLRHVGNSLVLHAFRVGVDSPVTKAGRDSNDGTWFAYDQRLGTYHTLPPSLPLPASVLTVIDHPY